MRPDLTRLDAQRTFQAVLQRQFAMPGQDAGVSLVPIARKAEEFAGLSQIEATADRAAAQRPFRAQSGHPN